MNKLEELKNYVAELFSAATDKTTIEKSAVVNQKIEEIEVSATVVDYDRRDPKPEVSEDGEGE